MDYIQQALKYRDHLKKAYEEECRKKGVATQKFTQTEATWTPATGMTTELLEAEGKFSVILKALISVKLLLCNGKLDLNTFSRTFIHSYHKLTWQHNSVLTMTK